MKAAVLRGLENIKVGDVSTPACGDGGILIKVESCAICRTDVKMFHVGHRDLKLPRILGHEIAGTVAEVGSRIRGKFRVGDKVQIAPGITCGSCPFCKKGASNMCNSIKIIGFHYNGGFAEYMFIPAKGVENGSVNKIPPSISSEEASLAEPIACCINALRQCRVEQGDVVAVFGAGLIGHLFAQLSRLFGASKVIVVERERERLKFAEQHLQVDAIINLTSESSIINIMKNEIDVVIPACSAPEVLALGTNILRKRGRIAFFSGLLRMHKDVLIDHNLIHYKELQISGAYGCTSEQNKEALTILSTGQVKVDYLITHQISLKELIRGFRLVDAHKAMKVVVKPSI